MNLEGLSVKELLILQTATVEELSRRNILRTKNNPTGDYAEWLVSTSLDLELTRNSEAGYDAISADGVRVQIKGRKVTPGNNSRQLSPIRNLDSKDFDMLAAVIFNEKYDVIIAVMMPHEVIANYARYSEHVHGHILCITRRILIDPRVVDIKSKLYI